jgi:hypothetical protein
MRPCWGVHVLQVNAQKLPEVDPSLGYGLRLADEKHLLVQPNWRIDVQKRDRQQEGTSSQRQ